MELRVLRYFLAVAREESILRAAETVHITQPALSRQIAQLEEEVGAKLFIRGNRKITLTDAGVLLRRRAEEIVALADKAEKELTDLGTGDVGGTISIGCGELRAMEELAGLVREFSQKYPNVNFNFLSANADSTKERIDKGLLDFGLLLEPVDYGKYDYVHMKSKEQWVAVMRADDPLCARPHITAEDLLGRKLILPSRRMVWSELSAWFGDVFEEKNIFSSNNLMNNAVMLVEQGLGVAIGVEYAPSLYDPKRFCYKKLYPELVSGAVMVWKKHQPSGMAAARFREFVLMSEKHIRQ